MCHTLSSGPRVPVTLVIIIAGLVGCAATSPAPQLVESARVESAAVSLPVERIDHFAVISARINDSVNARMMVDSGIGVTVISEALCQRIGCVLAGSFTGRRMSGQRVTVPLVCLRALSVAAVRGEEVTVGLVDAAMLPPGVDGILGLGFFKEAPVTIDYQAGSLSLETPHSLARRASAGVAVPVGVERDGPSLTTFMDMMVPHGPPVRLEIDTGSHALILHTRYMSRLGVYAESSSVERDAGSDETGHAYVRYFARIAGAVYPASAPSLRQESPRVMFQEIIHDGLVGTSYLERYAVTFDLPRSQMILGPSSREDRATSP